MASKDCVNANPYNGARHEAWTFSSLPPVVFLCVREGVGVKFHVQHWRPRHQGFGVVNGRVGFGFGFESVGWCLDLRLIW